MRLPRMTTRRWMVAVAVAAIGLGAWVLVVRSREYAVQAGNHGHHEAMCWLTIHAYEADPRSVTVSGPKPVEAIIDQSRRRAGYYAALKRKYEQAAHRPWLPVEPDPPPPE
jgi:hypothetical protein